MSIANTLLTAAEFARMPDPGNPQELVRGVIIDMTPPKPRHGKICVRIITYLVEYCDERELGHVLSNDNGVVTEQGPDTVRGPDVIFISYDKLPRDADLDDYLEVPPDAVFEVRSPNDRWTQVLGKVAEYLQFGVPAVYVFDPETERIHCYYPDEAQKILTAVEEFVGVGHLAEFRVPVARFFA